MMVEFNELNLAVLLQCIILFLSLQEFPHFTSYDMTEEEKSCTPLLPESNSIVEKPESLCYSKELTRESLISAVYTVTVVTVSSGPLSTTGWDYYFMCKDILAGLQEDVNR